MNTPNFPENCMKSKEFGRPGGGVRPSHPPRSANDLARAVLGGLSLHLNHLIESRMANYDWPFGTLPFGLFGSNLGTRDLETYPRTYSGHFLNM